MESKITRIKKKLWKYLHTNFQKQRIGLTISQKNLVHQSQNFPIQWAIIIVKRRATIDIVESQHSSNITDKIINTLTESINNISNNNIDSVYDDNIQLIHNQVNLIKEMKSLYNDLLHAMNKNRSLEEELKIQRKQRLKLEYDNNTLLEKNRALLTQYEYLSTNCKVVAEIERSLSSPTDSDSSSISDSRQQTFFK